MKTSIALAAAMILTLGLSSTAMAAAKVGEAAPDFTLKDQSGSDVKLADLKGKVVVLEWFNAGCPVTKRHHSSATPTMKNLASKYKANDVVWLAINSDAGSSVEKNKAAAEKLSVASPILDDGSGVIGKAYGAKSTPHMFIIDTQGKLAYAGAIDDDSSGDKGGAAKNYVAAALDELLAGKPVSTPQTRSYGCGIHYRK